MSFWHPKTAWKTLHIDIHIQKGSLCKFRPGAHTTLIRALRNRSYDSNLHRGTWLLFFSIQHGNAATADLIKSVSPDTSPVTNLGHQGCEEFSERGPNILNYILHIFWGVVKIFAGGLAPLRSDSYGPAWHFHLRFDCSVFVFLLVKINAVLMWFVSFGMI